MSLKIDIKREMLTHYNPILISSGNSFAQADIYRIDYKGQTIVLKDFVNRPSIFRATIGRVLIEREIKALKLLKHLPNVPSYLGMVDKYAFLMELVPGKRLPDKWESPPSIDSLSKLQSLVEEIHHCGVAHNDIRRTNIFIDNENNPYIFDFATAVFRDDVKDSLKNFLFSKCLMLDKVKILRIKNSYYKQLMTETEINLIAKGAYYIKLSTFWKNHIYRPFLKQARWRERFQRFKS